MFAGKWISIFFCLNRLAKRTSDAMQRNESYHIKIGKHTRLDYKQLRIKRASSQLGIQREDSEASTDFNLLKSISVYFDPNSAYSIS